MTAKISPAVQEAVQRVDAQIQQHLGLIQDLKSQRNALMPISRIPAEILGRIFHEVRGNNGHGYDDDDPFCTPSSYSEASLPEKSKPTLHQFKTMLESAPYLKRLNLKNVCPSTGSNRPNESAAPVLMQHLEYLDIEETIPRLIYFFRIFSASNLLKGFFININYQEEHASELSVLFAAVNRPYLYSVIGSSMDVRRLEIANYDGQLFTRASQISVLERNLEPNERQRPEYDHNSESMTIWLDTGSDAIEHEDLVHLTDLLLPGLFDNFSWTGLSELDVSSLDYAAPELLASTFGTVPQLRIIAADKYIAPWLIMALNYSSDANTNPAAAMSFSFPGLQHIDLGRTSLVEDDEDDDDFEAFCDCLQERHECGIPIISLKLNHEFLEEEVLSTLKKYVEHIILTPSQSEHVVDDYSPYNHTWYM